MTSHLHAGRRKNVIVTDLDLPDDEQAYFAEASGKRQQPALSKTRRQQPTEKNTISGNFNRRSRSAEVNVEYHAVKPGDKTNSKRNFNDLLQAKDKQMQQLIQRLGTLHIFNEQFSEENQKLRNDIDTLEDRVVVLQNDLKECKNCQKLNEQLSKSAEQAATYEADLEMMQTLVYRLNVQIEHYQDHLRHTKDTAVSKEVNFKSAYQENDGALNRHTLAPLLQSYDEMIREKQDLIQQYSQEFETFSGELKRVLEENTELLQSNESLKRDVGGWREERTRLQAQLDVCRKKAELHSRKSDLAKEKLVEVMQCYEQKMQTLILDMDHLQAAYTRCKAELASLKSLATQPKELIANSLDECKQLLQQLKDRHSKERQSLEHAITSITKSNQEYKADLQKLQQQNGTFQTEKREMQATNEELARRVTSLQHAVEKVKRSRDRLKARLRIALQWAKKLEEGQANIQGTWDALKRLETIVKHKESQVRGLHTRHVDEIEKMQRRLAQKEETIRSILKSKLSTVNAQSNDIG